MIERKGKTKTNFWNHQMALLPHPVCFWWTSASSSSSPSSCGVCLSAILCPSKRNLSEFIGTPCLWWYDLLSFLKYDVIFTLNCISPLSCPITLSLVPSPSSYPPTSSVEGPGQTWWPWLHPGVSTPQQLRASRTSFWGLQIHLFSTEQLWGCRDLCNV